MAQIEIERRFLLNSDAWRAAAGAPEVMQQGYISVAKECTIRVRVSGSRAWLTVKGYISDVSRHEFEYEIPLADAQTMLATVCPFKIEKHRYRIAHEGFVFEIDEFFGENAPFPKPDWLGAEITEDGRFTNAYLSKHPFGTWADEV